MTPLVSGATRWTQALGIAAAISCTAVAPIRVVAQGVEVPTRVVDVDGDSTRVAVLGMERRRPGDPALVIWAGGGVTVQGWGGFLQQAAELAPVVTWDRNGIGGSPFNGLSPTPARVIAHAHRLLSILDIPPPYIMVGHSFGAVHTIYYAGAYPEEVVGIVYLDPTQFRLTRYEWMNAQNEEEYRAYWDEWAQELAGSNLSPGQRAQLEASDVFLKTPLEDRGLPADPDVPTAMVKGALGDRTPEDLAREHPTLHETSAMSWISRMPRALFILSTTAGHYVHIGDPEAALSALRWVLGQVKSGR